MLTKTIYRGNKKAIMRLIPMVGDSLFLSTIEIYENSCFKYVKSYMKRVEQSAVLPVIKDKTIKRLVNGLFGDYLLA